MMDDPPPCYSSHDEYPTSSEVAAAATTQPIRNPIGQTQHDDGNTYDVINEFEEHTADGHRRHGDGHRRHGDGHGRHDDGHRRHGDGHGRHDDGHRRHGDGHGRHDDGHRRHGDGHGRHDDGHGIHGDGHGRHANRHVGDVDGQERHVEYRQDDMRIYPDALNQNHAAGIPEEHTAGDNANRIKRLQNAFRGFIDIMHDQKKLPSKGFLPYKLGLCVYLFINVMYSIVAAAVQSDHLAYHLMYVWISLIGFVIELVVIIIAITRQCFHRRYVDNRATQRGNQQVQDYRSKVISVLVDYVISSIGEFLIYPTLICVMYGFINERSWQFDNGIQICNFLLLVYSVIMDALYMKVYVIWLVIKIVQASYAKYDELTEVEWQRYFTPVYLSIPLAITTALTHWLMTGIIVVRIYVDNFTPEMNDTDSGIPDTGDYRVTSLTGYMIACTIYVLTNCILDYLHHNQQAVVL